MPTPRRTSHRHQSSSSESPGQGKKATQNLSQEVQSNINKLSSDDEDDEDDELNPSSNKKDDEDDELNQYFDKKDDGNNQDSDTSSKTDLNDLHKLKSFLHEELK